MFDKRCAVCGDMVGPYGDGKWLHVANQYPDPPHEVVLTDHMQRCGAAQGGMFCICDSLRDERAAALDAARDAVAGGFTTLLNDPFISPSARNAVDHYLTGAIEEIDALKGGQA